MTPCRDEAMRLLGMGYTPLPINPGTKRPWLAEWAPFQTRQPTEDEIDQWYTDHPAAGVGIVTTGLLIVDIDGPTNPWPEDPEQKMSLSTAPCVETPGGGRHFYFRAPAGHTWANWNSELAHKVDIKVDGGFLVVPPTPRPGGRPYAWQGEAWLDCGADGLPLPPAWLTEALDALGERRVSLYESKPLAGVILPGSRNPTLYQIACNNRAIGASEPMILRILEAINDDMTAKLSASEIAKIAHSAARHPVKEDVDLSAMVGPPAPARVLSMADLEALPPPTWLIEDVIPDRGLGFFVGDAGTGKSVFMLAVANSVARGIPLLGQKNVARTGWVLVLLAESIASWGARSVAFNAKHGLAPTDNFGAIIEGVDFSNPKAIAGLRGLVREEVDRRAELPALIILDTLSSAIPGVDENNQAAVTPLMAVLQAWVRHGIPVVVIHHPSKGGAVYRGSSVFKGNVDWMIGVEVNGSRHEIVRHKMRDLEWDNPLAFDIVKHGASIVAVGCSQPAALFMAASEPGLRDALMDHGLHIPGRDYRPAVGRRGFSSGVTVKELLATWGDTNPIVPTSASNREAYLAERQRRLRYLVMLVNSMVESGTLNCDKKICTRDQSGILVQPGLNRQYSHADTTYPPCDN